jgi:two-component system OmpR family sensor kinase
VRRWPIRLRITVGFAAAVGLLLTVVGAAAYHRLAAGFDDDLDRELHQRAQDLSGPLRAPGSSLRSLAGTGFIERGESFAEVQTADGRVVQATDTLTGVPLLSRDEITRAERGSILVDRPRAPGLDEPARLLATPVTRDGQRLVLVVGITRENGQEVLRRVRAQLLLGFPLLLVLTSGLGYLLAGAALRPVEEMRRRAASMSGGPAGRRLPVPPGDDELARLGVTLNELLARVDATLERERSFVANASHELRTPLALLRTELELAIRRPRGAAELTDAIGSATEEVERLVRLAEDLLVIASTDEGRLRIVAERLDVPALLQRVASRFGGLAAQQGRALELESGPARSVVADPQRLEQALVNLVGNAFQHGAGPVSLGTRQVDGATELWVADHGDGFDDAMLAHGFERFARTATGHGSGLGLSIVAVVAEAHGGTAGLANRATGGSVAWIRLPETSVVRPGIP